MIAESRRRDVSSSSKRRENAEIAAAMEYIFREGRTSCNYPRGTDDDYDTRDFLIIVTLIKPERWHATPAASSLHFDGKQ